MANTQSDRTQEWFAIDRAGFQGKSEIGVVGGRIRRKVAKVSTDGSEAANHVLRLFRARAHDYPVAIRIAHTAGGAGYADLDIACRVPSRGDADPAVLSAPAEFILCDGYDATLVANQLVDILSYEVSGATLHGRALWNWLAQTEPIPGTEYEMCLIIKSEPSTAEDFVVEYQYIGGD